MSNYSTLSDKYRIKKYFQLDEGEVGAYTQARMPATLAALSFVLEELKKRTAINVKKIFDFGAGPGTSYFAIRELFSEWEKIILIEKEESMIKAGKQLIEENRVEWVRENMLAVHPGHKGDLAIFGYSLGELAGEECTQILEKAWSLCTYIVIVEPGTPRGFERIKLAREWFLKQGGYIVAPCPHHKKCPMSGTDWCHFSVRLPRSKEHRHIKEASLGWEDEKFSYLIVSRHPSQQTAARVIRHPLKKSGHILLKLCTEEGLTEKIFSKRDKDLYRILRKTEWGDGLSSKQIIEETEHSTEDESV